MQPRLDTTKMAERYHAVFDSNMLGIVISDLDQKIIEANDLFLKLVGYSRKDLESGKLKWSSISPSKYDELDQKKIHELLHRGRILPFEKEYTHKKKYQVPVLVGAALIHAKPRLSICFALDISDQKKVEQKKDEFIGTVSHELRTPLAVLQLHAGLLKQAILSGQSTAEVLESIAEVEGQITQLAQLIADLLTFARLGDEKSFFSKKVFDLRKNVDRAVRNVRMVTKRAIICKVQKGEYIINGNPDRLMQVTLNLLMNAVQYSSPKTKIRVFITKKDDTVEVSIQDKGIGIDTKNIAHIFERHYRASHATQYAPQGAGIGLYICREIIRRHSGDIEVHSARGKGSTFSYTIPLAFVKDIQK